MCIYKTKSQEYGSIIGEFLFILNFASSTEWLRQYIQQIVLCLFFFFLILSSVFLFQRIDIASGIWSQFLVVRNDLQSKFILYALHLKQIKKHFSKCTDFKYDQ